MTQMFDLDRDKHCAVAEHRAVVVAQSVVKIQGIMSRDIIRL
jgi:hypothetical protein